MRGYRILIALWFVFATVAICFSCITLIQMSLTEAKAQEISLKVEPIISETVKTVKTVEVIECEVPEGLTLSTAEKELIAKLVHAEAGNQDQVGKRLVVDVIFNRLASDDFPDTVSGVIYQVGQFTTPANVYTADDLEAVEKELGDLLDSNVLYFRTGKYHPHGKKLYQHGAHYFSGGNA